MSHENQHKNLPNDQAKEGDKQPSITSAKTANENITAEPQAPSYEAKFHSFSSSSDSTATTGDDQPLLDLIKRVTGGGNNTESQGRAVSEFAIEDAAQGVVHTHRGAERLGAQAEQAATAEPAPRQSFLDGLKKIFDHASSPEERDQMQSAFSIDYMMRKAKEFIGDVQSLITGKPVAVEKLPYDSSTGADVQQLPFRPGEKDSQPVPMIIRERMSPDEPEAARSLGVQITEAVINAAGADAYNPSTGTLQNDAGGDTAEDKSAVPPRPPRPGEEDARQREEMIIRQQMSPGETESLRLGGQFAQAAIDATGANAYNPNAGTLPIDSAGRPSTAEDRSTVRPHPPRPGEEDARREEMIIRQQMSPGESEARRLGGQFAQAAINATGADAHDPKTGTLPIDSTPRPLPFRPGIDDDRVETLPYKPGDNDKPVQQIIRETLLQNVSRNKDFIETLIAAATSFDFTHHSDATSQETQRKVVSTSIEPNPALIPSGLHEDISAEVKARVFHAESNRWYAGESALSKSSIPCGTYVKSPSETLEMVAAKHLGNEYSSEQLSAYARELAHVNGITEGQVFKTSKDLVLPGHDGKGGLVLGLDRQYSTTMPDGSHSMNTLLSSRSFVERRSDKETLEHHTGTGAADRFALKRNADGGISYFEESKDGKLLLLHANKSEAVQQEHDKLHKLADLKIRDPLDRAKFEVDMLRFEERCQRKGLSNEEVVATYKQIGRLMESHSTSVAGDGHAPSPFLRLRLAEEVMAQAAEPRIINQGQYNTCQVTCIEAMIYETQPSKAAELVASVGITGKYQGADGTTVELDSASIVPQGDGDPLADGTRSFATQLFNVTAVNLTLKSAGLDAIYSQDDHGKTSLTDRRYTVEQLKRLYKDDHGERLYIKRTGGPEFDVPLLGHVDMSVPVMKGLSKNFGRWELSDQVPPDLTSDQIVGSYLLITGKHPELYTSVNRSPDFVQALPGRTECGVELAFDENIYGPGKLVDAIHTEQDLRNKLLQLSERHAFPIMLRVHAANQPFYRDSNEESAGGSGGWHGVRITGFDAKTGLVKVDNNWDSDVDHEEHPIPIHQLYLAMKPPDKSCIDLQRDVEANRASGHIDTCMELELLRLKHTAHKLNDSDYGWDVARTMDEARKRWADLRLHQRFGATESLDQKDAEAVVQEMVKVWHKASPDTEQAYNQGNLGDLERTARLAQVNANNAAKNASKEWDKLWKSKEKAPNDEH